MTAPLVLFALLACSRSSDIGGQTGEEMRTCAETRAAVDPDDSSAGFAAADLLSAYATQLATLRWTTGGETPLTITLSASGDEVVWVHQEPIEPGDAGLCADALIFPVTVGFSTEDGAFDEVFSLSFNAWSGEMGETSAEVEDAALTGSYRAPSPALLNFSLGWNPSGHAGQITAYDNASDAISDVALWGQ